MARAALVLACVAALVGCAKTVEQVQSPPHRVGSEIVMPVAAAQNADPFEAGRAAAETLKKTMLNAPHAVLISECFEGEDNKKRLLKGVCSVFPSTVVFGGATYGSFTHKGAMDRDAVALLGIAGQGISVSAALEQNLGTAGLTMEKDEAELASRLRAAGARLAKKIPQRSGQVLLIVMADAHSPTNAFLVEGIQSVVGKKFPITGGSVNKNAGQTYVYFQGRMYPQSAIALMLGGQIEVGMSGRQAKDNAKVIETARVGAAEAKAKLKANAFSALAFDCAGRKGKLDRLGDELAAMQGPVGRDVPLFGCYCAGEIGPADVGAKDENILSSGAGWHVMFTFLGK